MNDILQLTQWKIDYVLQELEAYAHIHNNKNAIEIVCYKHVWKLNALVPPALLSCLLAEVEKLQGKEKDWHPGSDSQVLNLVHPSLYSIAYGKSFQKSEDVGIREVYSAPQ